ncbi:MAG: DUF1275 domain-containing protein [Sphingomonadales bacterium]|nr:DUF1275 domain-containing protein [Sphingomonadales bacterium]MDE2169765.1 DUF1275 domain-containing protein [Sphingomonadales bacterium]
MLIQRGDDRSQHLDRRLAFILAAVAGSLNAAAFHAVGFFSANMTGNVSTLSSLIAMGEWLHGLGYLVIVLAFVLGAALSALTVDVGLRRGVDTIYARIILAEAVMLVLLALARLGMERARGVPLLIVGLSFLMGLQNAIVTHISQARVRTTHVSGMATDLGIGLGRLLAMARGRGAATADGDRDGGGEERAAILLKLRLHAGTIACFLLGGVLGVLGWRWCGDLAMALSALPLFGVGLAGLLGASPSSRENPAAN